MAIIRFNVLTLFPEMIMDGLNHSIIGRAVSKGIISLRPIDIRDFTENKHRQADDYPYGGGCGMVMKPEPVYRAYLEALKIASDNINPRVLYMTPRGRPFNQALAREYSGEKEIIILCGHYEGIDERAIELIKPEAVSVGDYVLSGGELAAMAVIDATARLVPGVLKNDGSPVDESFSPGLKGLLEYPQYTRPAEFMGLKVPQVLLGGDHGKIAAWRWARAHEVTMESRPDMMALGQSCQSESNDLVFVRPSLDMKEDALAFREEFVRENSGMNGSANFLKYDSYEEWISDLERIEKGEIEGRIASTVLFALSRQTGEIIGITDIKHRLVDGPDHLPSYVNGNIGGSIRPSRRGFGYAQKLLKMSIAKCAEYGNTRILITCDKNNPVSEHIITKCGGVFDNEVVEQSGNVIRRFWINLYGKQAE